MPRKTEWTVRVIIFYPTTPGHQMHGHTEFLSSLWVEQLRYMGFAKELAEFDDSQRTVVEFRAPAGLNDKVWAEQNAERMQSFGFNAVAAPKWERGTDLKSMYKQAKAMHPEGRVG